jgi:hypothetical protein
MDKTLTDTLNQIVGSKVVLVLTQIAVGLGLLYAIDKFFKLVEEKLSDDTKLEIAVWLVGVKVGQKVEPWPKTFAQVFNRVFGKQHFSLKCLSRSIAITIGISLLWAPLYALRGSLGYFTGDETLRFTAQFTLLLLVLSLLINVLPDYCSLGETRIVLWAMQKTNHAHAWILLLFADLFVTMLSSVMTFVLWGVVSTYFAAAFGIGHPVKPGIIAHSLDARSFMTIQHALYYGWYYGVDPLWFMMFVLPCILTSIWLWLYAGSGFLLKAARRFDIGFDWFNRKFDIEKKPLQSIGLVAGALVAVVYWSVVIVSRVIG